MVSGSPVAFPVRPFVGPGRVLYGTGSATSLATELTALGGRPSAGLIMVVVDAALLQLGLVAPVLTSLEAEGFTVRVGPGVTGEPGPDTIVGLLDAAGNDPVAAVVGVGGGSALDAAKLVAAAATNELELTLGLAATTRLEDGPLFTSRFRPPRAPAPKLPPSRCSGTNGVSASSSTSGSSHGTRPSTRHSRGRSRRLLSPPADLTRSATLSSRCYRHFARR